LAIILPEDQRQILAAIAPDEKITVDLPNQEVRYADYTFPFEIDPLWKDKFIKGLDDIAITMGYEDQIEAYEAKIPSYN
jgi:3-isopropylmalate dehydratase small subunit